MYSRYHVYLSDGYFIIGTSKHSGWIHVVLNYIGPSDGEGIRVYYNGMEVANATTKSEFHRPISSGDGRIVVGREVTNLDGSYASMEIDELIFFNNALSTTNIKLLYNVV